MNYNNVIVVNYAVYLASVWMTIAFCFVFDSIIVPHVRVEITISSMTTRPEVFLGIDVPSSWMEILP